MMCLLIFLTVIFLLVLAFILGSEKENWETAHSGKAKYALFGGMAVITIERHKLTKEVRAFVIDGNEKKPLNIDFARQLIGKERSWLA